MRGWEATGELNARQPDSGATVEIFVETETNRVGLLCEDGGDLGRMVQLSRSNPGVKPHAAEHVETEEWAPVSQSTSRSQATRR